MASAPLPTPDILRQLLRYEPDTGRLFWLAREPRHFNGGPTRSPAEVCQGWNAYHAGKRAFEALHNAGYHQGMVLSYKLLAHRTIWAMVHDRWPTFIDHINGVRGDDRLVNLREVTRSENQRNQKRNAANTSGQMGVNAMSSGRWTAKIKANHRQIYLGTFATAEEATAVRKAAESMLGFHPGHGRS